MADMIDDAQDKELMERESSLAAALQHIKPQTHPDFDGVNCLDCSDPLPDIRLRMGRIRCVYCQELLEAKGRGRW